MRMEATFWGVRGSISCSSPEYVVYGGNTACVELDIDGRTVIIDAGSGIRALGESLMRRGISRMSLLISHTHWDHICGFPFFYPAFRENSFLSIYASRLPDGSTARQVFETQMSAPFFPLPMHMVPSVLHFHDFDAPSEFTICDGAVNVKTCPLNHPNGATGYRLDYKGKSLAYISDTEHRADGSDADLVEFIRDADLMIYDAMYTPREYPHFIGWGHSTWEEALRLTRLANVKKTALFHHSPAHDDRTMAKIEKEASKADSRLFTARDGLKVEI